MGKAGRLTSVETTLVPNDVQRLSRQTRRKTPVQRAIDFQATFNDASQWLRGTLYANDFCDGATAHQLEGYLTDQHGVERRFSGRLDGVQFVSKEARGAPKKTGRDVALHLAYMWFLGRAKRSEVGRPESDAREQVMQLWIANGFRGVSEETHLRKRMRAGAQAAYGLSLLRFEAHDVKEGGAVIAAPTEAFVFEQGRISVSGQGWFWRYGMEAAVHGGHSATIPLTKEQS